MIRGTSFILLASKSTWKYTKSLSHVVCFHIINPYTQFAGRVLFHRALYASSRGSVSHACRLPQHLPPLIGRHPETTLSPLSLIDVNLLDQIPCCSHIWGYWGSLQKFGPRETQPRKQKDVPVWYLSQLTVLCWVQLFVHILSEQPKWGWENWICDKNIKLIEVLQIKSWHDLMQICFLFMLCTVNSYLAIQMISVCISRDCLIRFNFLVQHTINEVHCCYRNCFLKKKKNK